MPIITYYNCFIFSQLLDAMNQDSGIPITSLQVDGGMTANNLLMQLQSDIVGIPVGQYNKSLLIIRLRLSQRL